MQENGVDESYELDYNREKIDFGLEGRKSQDQDSQKRRNHHNHSRFSDV